MLAILEYGAGNQTSVQRALSYLGIESTITADPQTLLNASGLIFPGVGAAGQAMERLCSTGLDNVLRQAVERGIPLLGICLGCQILLESSEEGLTQTLGLIPGVCRRFPSNITDEAGEPLRVPHMGWNNAVPVAPAGPSALAAPASPNSPVTPVAPGAEKSPLFNGIAPDAQFYFVHSFYPEPAADYVAATTKHGISFASVFGRPGLWAVQFHPEKSGEPGLRLLKNFSDWCASKEAARA